MAGLSLGEIGPIKNELFYFKTFGRFYRTLPEVVDGPESESAAHFFWPRFHWPGTGQSEMSFSILRLLAVLIELSYRLPMSLNPNPKPIFLAEISLVRNRPIKNELFIIRFFEVLM